MLISGRCHCGNISLAPDWRPEPSEIPARACTCSFCAKHGGVWTSRPTGSLMRIKIRVRSRCQTDVIGAKDRVIAMDGDQLGLVPLVVSSDSGWDALIPATLMLRVKSQEAKPIHEPRKLRASILSRRKHGSKGIPFSDAHTASPRTRKVPAGSETARTGPVPPYWMVPTTEPS